MLGTIRGISRFPSVSARRQNEQLDSAPHVSALTVVPSPRIRPSSTMLRASSVKARIALITVLALALVSFLSLGPYRVASHGLWKPRGHATGAVLTGHAIAPALGNATAKYGHNTLPAHARRTKTDGEMLAGQNWVAPRGKFFTPPSPASPRSRRKRSRRLCGPTCTYSSGCTPGRSGPAETMRVLADDHG